MKADDVVRVFGKADDFDIEFTETQDEMWTCTVPPDLTDGQYATEIFAIFSSGDYAYWTGILYMSNGKPYLVLKRCKYFLRCLPERYELKLVEDR